jgi:3',5'-cyclic AMP phosphodiesterase CpdA
MLIAQISDTHILAQASEHPSAELRADCLRRTVDHINGQRPDAVIFTGDTTQHGAPGEYARLRELLDPLVAPLYLVPGNRDDNEALRAAFSDHAHLPREGGFLHYAVEDHEVRLLAIDSTSPGERKGVFCPDRQAWLDAALAEAPARATLLFIHHPPFDVGEHYVGGYRRAGDAAALADIAGRHSQVIGLVCGHVHWLIETQWAGVPARIMPSIAVDLRKGIDESEARGRPIYLLHRLSEAGGVVSVPKTVGA